MKKRVSFSKPIVTGVVWLQVEDRHSLWEEVARDRARFKRRIEQIEHILNPVLSKKIHEIRNNN